MLGTKIELTVFAYLVIIAIIIPIATFIWFVKINESYRLRYLLLSICFFFYNLASGLTPDTHLPVNLLSQHIVAYTMGTFTALYFLFYLYREYGIRPVRFLTVDLILKILVLDLIVGFIIPFTITENLNLSRNIFLVVPLLIAIAALFNIYYHLYRDFSKNANIYYRIRLFFGGYGMISILLLPAVIILYGDWAELEHTIFTSGFFVITAGYFLRIRYLSYVSDLLKVRLSDNNAMGSYSDLEDVEKELLYLMIKKPVEDHSKLLRDYQIDNDTIGQISEKLYALLSILNGGTVSELLYEHSQILDGFGLSKREYQISKMIISDTSYSDIADKLYIDYGTVTKHASNIFKKAQVSDKKAFQALFLG